MTTQNSTQATVSASYVVNHAKGEVNVIVTTKKEPLKEAKPVMAFAKNKRYSIYNNGGGYTGL
jgi:hypothetical protein